MQFSFGGHVFDILAKLLAGMKINAQIEKKENHEQSKCFPRSQKRGKKGIYLEYKKTG